MLKRTMSLILSVVFILCFVPLVWPSNTITVSGHTITIQDIDSDWLSATDTTNLTTDQNKHGLYVHSIYFKPAATDDTCLIYVGSTAAGSLTFNPLCADAYDERIKYYPYGPRRQLYLDFSNGTYTAGSTVVIELWKY